MVYSILHHLTDSGRSVFLDWFDRLHDERASSAILRRLARMETGNFGDHAFCREGVWELRIDVGAGYRVYYAIAGRFIVLLLCGGDKRSQAADITRACRDWRTEKRRLTDGN